MQFLQDCDQSQALFESTESVTDIWNHGFALLAVLFASFTGENRFSFFGLICPYMFKNNNFSAHLYTCVQKKIHFSYLA